MRDRGAGECRRCTANPPIRRDLDRATVRDRPIPTAAGPLREVVAFTEDPFHLVWTVRLGRVEERDASMRASPTGARHRALADCAERREGLVDFPPRSPHSATALVADRGRVDLLDAAHQELPNRRQSQRRVEWFFLDGLQNRKWLPDFDMEGRYFA